MHSDEQKPTGLPEEGKGGFLIDPRRVCGKGALDLHPQKQHLLCNGVLARRRLRSIS